MNASEPYYQQGVHYLGASTFLHLAVAEADQCAAEGFALKAHIAQIMAAVSAEAFIDEFSFLLASLGRCDKAPDLVRVGTILQQLEASRVQVTEKYHITSQLLPGNSFDYGREPLQSFSQLIKLRNFLAHPKVSDKPPGWFSYFVSNRLLVQATDDEFILPNWSQQLQSKRCASWACRATARILLELIDRVREPCNNYGVPGIHETFTSAWEWARTDRRIWT